ncbi:MAG: transporter [Flavobacteriaceae bacterium]|nr:transporter [Flavobacteriaceae bacterium]|tara:strand:- start:7658 stop:8584 length:927 start_codon:yes stop_codon:yes gene_type:complete
MKLLQLITQLFPLWVVSFAILSLYEPIYFTWFSGNLITYGLGGIMLGMGLTLNFNDFKLVFNTPRWVFVGVALQFIIMPILGWVLALLFELPTFFAVGLILVSCCPGGTASNVIVYLARSNLALSVSMTICSTFLAIILTPLLTTIYSGSYLEVDGWGLFYSTLKVVLLPVSIGILFNKFLPKLTKLIVPFSPPMAVILITLIVASIIGQGKEIIIDSAINLILAIIILHFFGFVLGYIISFIVLKDKNVSKTISIEVGMQNSGLGVVLAKENFINPATAIPSAISSLIHSVYGSIFVGLFKNLKQKI